MPSRLIPVDALYQGAAYAYAAMASPSDLIFTAGACPLNGDGVVVCVGDIPGQTRRALSNLQEALAAAGAKLTDVVKTTVYVVAKDRAELVSAWREVESVFGSHPAPSTLLGVALLGYKDQLVEIEAIAACSPSQGVDDGR